MLLWEFSLQNKSNSQPYQSPQRCIAYALQRPFKEALEQLKQQDVITLLSMDETGEWCNSFILVPKPNGKVRLCLDTVRLNQALIRLVYRGPTLIDILPKLNNAKYFSLINMSSGYHDLKLNERSPYFTRFTCKFGRYRCKRLLFEAAPKGDIFE